MGGGHLRAGSARRAGGAASGLPAVQTVQSSEGRRQVSLPGPGWPSRRSLTAALCPEGSGGRRRGSSPELRGNASAPSRCPASSVTTATSPGCPPMPSHTRGRWRTRCPVHTRSSPSWTCSRGRNRTQVRKTLAPPSPLRFTRLRLSFRSHMWTRTQNSLRLLAAVRLGGCVSVSEGLQTVGVFAGQL